MRFRWLFLLSSFLSVFFFSAAAQARELVTWRFDRNQNRLVFTTDAGVQPKAQLISNPTRVVIDLPGIGMKGPTANQRPGGAIQEIRVGKLDNQTTRIVIELAPGYTLDPQQVKFRGATPTQWSVDLPTPQPIPPSFPPPRQPSQPPVSSPPSNQSSQQPNNPLLSPPPLLETPNRPMPTSGVGQLATIQSIELANNGTQLLIRADQRVRATSTWDAKANGYSITIPGSRLADQVRGPQLSANSALSRVLIRQQDSRTVVILVQPSIGTQIGELNQLNDQLLALQLQQARPIIPPTASIPVPPPERTTPVPPPPINYPPARPPAINYPPAPLPRIPNGRIIVMVDPGHGGPDPGAIGLGGLRETNVVLPIAQQVAAILNQQGIQAVLTRTGEYDVDLAPRVAMAERMDANLFVSIHANSINLSRTDINGLETYYYSSASAKRLAQSIHNSILQSMDIRDRGVRSARFYVLRKTSMPSVLVEVGFVTGREDAAKLSNPTYRSQMAQAIARGILQYIQQNS